MNAKHAMNAPEFDPYSITSSTIVKDCHCEYGTAEGGGGYVLC